MAALIWLPVSLLLAGLMGAVTMGFGIAGVGVVATVIVTASLFLCSAQWRLGYREEH